MTRNHSYKSHRAKKSKKNVGAGLQASASNVKIETIRRIIIFTTATLILGAAQCSFFPLIKICPRTPDLILGLILATALCDNTKTALVLSVGAGFFIDAIGGGVFAFSPLIYFIYAVIISTASQKFLKSFPAFVVLLIPSMFYRAAITTGLTFLNSGSITKGIVPTLLLEALCTFILCLPLYPIITLAAIPLFTRKKYKR